MNYKVHEIFGSVEGEGIRTGLASTFIRLYGCNLSCSYCDTDYSCKGGDFMEMGIADILKAVEEIGIKNITLTGGEPLFQEHVLELVKALSYDGFKVNIETNGSILVHDYLAIDDVIITMDFKSHSSGMAELMVPYNLKVLREQDVVKFVVGDTDDLSQMLNTLQAYDVKAQVFVSPIYGQIEPKELVKFVLGARLHNVRVQVQLHKIIWDPAERGV